MSDPTDIRADNPIQFPALVRHARYRWDRLREQHQIVYPEGILVLNETGAAIARLCDGRSMDDLIAELDEQSTDRVCIKDVNVFLMRLAEKGLLRDAGNS